MTDKLALYDAQRQAQLAAIDAVQNTNCISHNFARLARILATGDLDTSKDGLSARTHALAIVLENEELTTYLAEALHELVTSQTALAETARTLMEQRDQAIEQLHRFSDDLVTRVAEHQGCSKDQAYNLLAVLANPDETVMQDYEICDLDSLTQFRDQLDRLLGWLGYEDS